MDNGDYLNTWKLNKYEIIELKNRFHFENIRDEWNALIIEDIYYLTLTYDWFYSTWKSLTGWKNVCAIAIRENGELISVIPLVLEKDINKTEDIIIPTTIIPLTSKGDFDDLLKCLQYYLDLQVPNWKRILLEEVDSDFKDSQKLLQSIEKNKLVTKIEKEIETPILVSDTDFDSYIQKRIKKVKNAMGNNEHKLSLVGKYQLKIYSSLENLDEALRKVHEIDCLSWKFNTASDMSSREGQLIFYETLAIELSKKGFLKIGILEFEETGEPIAFQYIIHIGNKVLNAKHSYKEKYREFSPGVILRYELIKYLLTHNVNLIDTWSSKDRFKMIWCQKTSIRQNLCIDRFDL